MSSQLQTMRRQLRTMRRQLQTMRRQLRTIRRQLRTIPQTLCGHYRRCLWDLFFGIKRPKKKVSFFDLLFEESIPKGKTPPQPQRSSSGSLVPVSSSPIPTNIYRDKVINRIASALKIIHFQSLRY